MINGNREKHGYKFVVWNCNRGLLTDEQPNKLSEVKEIINSRKPHCLGIIEADLHGPNSQANRVTKYTAGELREKLKIDGYRLEFPRSWDVYGQARLVCYVSKDIKYSRKDLCNNYDHLQSITLEVGLGKATKSIVHYYYR